MADENAVRPARILQMGLIGCRNYTPEAGFAWHSGTAGKELREQARKVNGFRRIARGRATACPSAPRPQFAMGPIRALSQVQFARTAAAKNQCRQFVIAACGGGAQRRKHPAQ
jgi:hypothetical protein